MKAMNRSPLVPSILLYEATSMRKPAAKSPTAPIQTSAFPKDESQRLFISSRYRTSQLVEALKPFGQLAFPDAPLAADFESRQFLVLDHAVHCSLRHLQQLSGFVCCQESQRLSVVVHRRWATVSNGNAMTHPSPGQPWVGKSRGYKDSTSEVALRNGCPVAFLELWASTKGCRSHSNRAIQNMGT